MRMDILKIVMVAIGAAVSLGGGPAAAQWPGASQGGAATIYRDPNFRGPAVAVDRANSNMQLNYQVFSIRARGSWELCPEPNFRGQCLIVAQDTADLRRTYNWPGRLQSMRPISGGPPPFQPPAGGGGNQQWGQSLRGMSSEFFPAPRQGNSRVLACTRGTATPSCASASADQFCRSRGWRHSAREMMETENRRAYLADVLCANS